MSLESSVGPSLLGLGISNDRRHFHVSFTLVPFGLLKQFFKVLDVRLRELFLASDEQKVQAAMSRLVFAPAISLTTA